MSPNSPMEIQLEAIRENIQIALGNKKPTEELQNLLDKLEDEGVSEEELLKMIIDGNFTINNGK